MIGANPYDVRDEYGALVRVEVCLRAVPWYLRLWFWLTGRRVVDAVARTQVALVTDQGVGTRASMQQFSWRVFVPEDMDAARLASELCWAAKDAVRRRAIDLTVIADDEAEEDDFDEQAWRAKIAEKYGDEDDGEVRVVG